MESVCAVKRTVGSNPTPSANTIRRYLSPVLAAADFAGAGRDGGAAEAAGFLPAFGFLASRLLFCCPLAIAALPCFGVKTRWLGISAYASVALVGKGA